MWLQQGEGGYIRGGCGRGAAARGGFSIRGGCGRGAAARGGFSRAGGLQQGGASAGGNAAQRAAVRGDVAGERFECGWFWPRTPHNIMHTMSLTRHTHTVMFASILC